MTGAAQFCQQERSRLVVRRGGHYGWAAQDHQPDLLDAVRPRFPDPPPGATFATAGSFGRHGARHERRPLSASALLSASGYLRWPHAAPVGARPREGTRKGKRPVEWGYAIPRLRPGPADARRVRRVWRGHGGSDTTRPWGRDVTFAEHRSQGRTGAGPQVMAARRSTASGILRRAGHPHIAAARRTSAGRPHTALGRLGRTIPALPL